MKAYHIEFVTKKDPQRELFVTVEAKDAKSAKAKIEKKIGQAIKTLKVNVVGYF